MVTGKTSRAKSNILISRLKEKKKKIALIDPYRALTGSQGPDSALEAKVNTGRHWLA